MYKEWKGIRQGNFITVTSEPNSTIVEDKKPRKAKSFNGRSTTRIYSKSWSEESRNVEKLFELVKEEERARSHTDPVQSTKIESGD